MSDDGGSSGSDGGPEDGEDGTMEITVETLTGTTFEMTVAAGDTVGSIKHKIQRVEGIPVAQQHLVYRLHELRNEARLSEHGVSAGCTLRLVLSMRGGPISTRRLPPAEHHLAWRELKEYVDTTREDLVDKLPPGAKVTVLLFRDGDNINLIRVIEHEDGTCYPYADAWPPARSAGRDAPPAKGRERSSENHALAHKVAALRRQMEGLSVQRRTRKPAASGAERCEASRPQPAAAAAATEGLRVGKSLSEIYVDRLLLLEQRRNSRSNNIGRSHRPHRVDAALSVQADEPLLAARNCSLATPSIAILEEEPESKKDADFVSARNLLHRRVVHRPQSSPERDAAPYCNALFTETGERRNVPGLGAPRVQLASPGGSNLLTSQFASTSQLNSAHLDSVLGGRVRADTGSGADGRRVAGCGRRARIERVRNGPEDACGGYSNLGYIANIEKVQNFVSGLERPFKLPRRRCEGQPTAPVSAAAVPSTSAPSSTLPAIGATKKPARMRCAQCHKRLNITTLHTCRCGGTFCSQHRYSEVHGCQYDYKTEGRKILEQANPLVAAPKLPKI